MALYAKGIDSAFQHAGTKPGQEIWCVENLKLVALPKSLYGKFYSGNAYLLLNTFVSKNGLSSHDIHYWIGKDANEEESALASDKALELDEALGSCTVQYREVEGQETAKFLSYFKPCTIPIQGVYSSQPGSHDGGGYKAALFSCKGEHVVSVKGVPFHRSSLNQNHVFILDTAPKIYLFSGCNSSIQERAKALEVVHYIKENKHGGKCEVATIEDGILVGDPDVGEFWSLFGGYAPIPKDVIPEVQQQCDTNSVQLFWITTQGKLRPIDGNSLSKDLLESNKCYMLDSGAEIFVWMGKTTFMTERKTSISAIEEFVRNQGRSSTTHLSFSTEGSESPIFRSHFGDWPQVPEPKLYEEGREKVAAMFKQNGYEVKELPIEEDHIPSISCHGKLKVWLVNGKELMLLPVPEQTRLLRGDCYIVQYTYENNQRDEHIIYAWFGRESRPEDKMDAVSSMDAIADSAKGAPTVAQVIQDKEPDLFFLIFKTLLFYKGGLSKRYKGFLADLGVSDDTYDGSKTSLFRVQGTGLENMQAVQVDLVSTSLNSSYCFILQSGTSVFTWIGNLASSTDHDLLDRMLERINPTWQPVSVREGNEPDDFWNALGGKTDYPKGKEIRKHTEDPHLFKVMINKGDFKVKEVYNFTQDDLTTEDVFILNCHEEIFIWTGRHSIVKSKQQALHFSLKFLQIDPLVEGLSLEAPIYVVAEGNEPPMFTRFFEWDSTKASMHGNSFERKLALLKVRRQSLEGPARNSWTSSSREATPDRRKSISSSNGSGNVFPSATNGSGSRFTSPDRLQFSTSTPATRKLLPQSPNGSSPRSAIAAPSRRVDVVRANGVDSRPNSLIYPYERVKVNSADPATSIDASRRETYLSDEEFQEKLGMTRKAFYGLAGWKQNKLKMSVHLF